MADAVRDVDSGDAVALVEVSVSQLARSMSPAVTLLLPVDSQTLMAGTLPNGPVESLEEGGSTLTPGTWIVLVGNAPESPDTYFLSDGAYGAFSFASRNSVREGCSIGDPGAGPSGEGPAEPVNDLVAWFQKALGKKATG